MRGREREVRMSSKERHVSDQVKEGAHLARHASPMRKIREGLSFLLCETVFNGVSRARSGNVQQERCAFLTVAHESSRRKGDKPVRAVIAQREPRADTRETSGTLKEIIAFWGRKRS